MKIKPFLVVIFTLGLFYFYYSIFTFSSISSFTVPTILILTEKPTTSTEIIIPDSSKNEQVVISTYRSTKHYQNKETNASSLQLNTRFGSLIWVF